jgi:hypothetical protein
VHQQGEPASGAGGCGPGDEIQLHGSGIEIACQELAVDGDQPPPRHVELPEVFAKVAQIALARGGRDERLARARNVVGLSHIVIAGDEARRQPDGLVQTARLRQIAFLGDAVEGYVARVHHQVRCRGDKRSGNKHEVLDKERPVAAEVGVGDLGEAECHKLLLTP